MRVFRMRAPPKQASCLASRIPISDKRESDAKAQDNEFRYQCRMRADAAAVRPCFSSELQKDENCVLCQMGLPEPGWMRGGVLPHNPWHGEGGARSTREGNAVSQKAQRPGVHRAASSFLQSHERILPDCRDLAVIAAAQHR